MIGSGDAETRAVAGAIKSAVGQVRLDAGVNITGLLVDIDMADDVDFRKHFMCWHLTRVLGPSLTEMVPPAVVRSVAGRETVQMHCETPDWPQLGGDWAAMVNGNVSAGIPSLMGSVRDVSAYASTPDVSLIAFFSMGPAATARSSLHRELSGRAT